MICAIFSVINLSSFNFVFSLPPFNSIYRNGGFGLLSSHFFALCILILCILLARSLGISFYFFLYVSEIDVSLVNYLI